MGFWEWLSKISESEEPKYKEDSNQCYTCWHRHKVVSYRKRTRLYNCHEKWADICPRCSSSSYDPDIHSTC
jgi:hypothetical protein